MAEGKHEEKDEEPQEEFVNEGIANEEAEEKPDSVKYHQWSLEDLRRKAEKKNIAGYDKLNRNELIKNLKRL